MSQPSALVDNMGHFIQVCCVCVAFPSPSLPDLTCHTMSVITHWHHHHNATVILALYSSVTHPHTPLHYTFTHPHHIPTFFTSLPSSHIPYPLHTSPTLFASPYPLHTSPTLFTHPLPSSHIPLPSSHIPYPIPFPTFSHITPSHIIYPRSPHRHSLLWLGIQILRYARMCAGLWSCCWRCGLVTSSLT